MARPGARCAAAGSTSGVGEPQAQQEWFEGMDPNSTYLLKIKLLGNQKKGRKEFSCFYFEIVIDSDLTNYKDLVESVVEKYPPGYLETAHVQYHDEAMNTFPEVKSDQELMSMFEKHSKSKVVHMFIAYCDPAEPYEPIKEWHSDVQRQANNTEQKEDNYLLNPLPVNEHVGVDEEIMYLENAPVIPINVVVSGDKDKDYFDEDDSQDDSELEIESGTEVEDDEESVGHEADHIPNIEYNKEDSPMAVGSTYPSMVEFKLALSQHAIKQEFECNTEKSAPYRFRAYCSRRDEDNCQWRIPFTADDLCTVVVRKNPCAHDCSSTRRKKKVKNATKHRVCAKVKDWLIDDPTIRARVLQKKLKEHYKPKLGDYKKKRKPRNSDSIASKSKSLEATCQKKGKHGNSDSGPSKRSSGSNQPEPISIEFHVPTEQTNAPVKEKTKKKGPAKKKTSIPMVPLDSPSLNTRSKKRRSC